MTDRLDLPLRYREELKVLLRRHVPDAEVWAYGSRVNGRCHAGSDLDLVLRGPEFEPLGYEHVELVEALEQSNIPILVRAHDWARLPESFHREIERDYVVVQKGDLQSAMGGWRKMRVGEFAPFSYGKSLSTGKRNPSGSIPVVGSNGIVGYHDSAVTDGPTVVVGRKGTVGAVNYFPGQCWPIDTTFYVTGEDADLTRFKFYALSSLGLDQMNSDSAVPGLNRDAAHARELYVPGETEQRRISHILGALDDRIELNRRMNETLEAMARAVFQDWFVDFGPVRAKLEGREPYLPPELWDLFPDRLVDSELGEIPEGWEVTVLGEIGNLNPEAWSKANRPACVEYVDLANTKWGVIESTQHFVWKDAPSRAKRVLRTGDTIVGTVRPGNGSYSLIGNDGLTGSTGFAVLRPSHPHFRELVYLSATALDNIERLAHRADGAAYPAVRPEIVAETEVAIPAYESRALGWFSKTVGPILDKMESVKAESRALAAQRDVLLPKLVSGELRV